MVVQRNRVLANRRKYFRKVGNHCSNFGAKVLSSQPMNEGEDVESRDEHASTGDSKAPFGGAANQAGELAIDTPNLARNVLVFCLVTELLFVFLDYHLNFGSLVKIVSFQFLFNIANETGFAAWFATTQTLLAGLTLWFIYALVCRQPGPRWIPIGWLVLAVFFTYMAVDDGTQLHERVGTIYGHLQGDTSGSDDVFPSYNWQLIFLPIFGTLGIFSLAFLWFQLNSTSSRILLVAALGCLVVAVVMDFFEGLAPDHRWNIYRAVSDDFDLETWTETRHPNKLEAWTQARFERTAYDTLRHFSQSIEETLEMIGNSIFWFLFLRHLSTVTGNLHIRFLRR